MVLAAAAAALCGCMVGPDFEPPKADMPNEWSAGRDGTEISDSAEPLEMSPEALAKWWEIFDDPTLTSLISRAFEGNLSIRAATERIAQARATLGISQSGFFPAANLNAGMSEGGHPIDVTHTSYSMGATASWEIDVFGGVRRGIEAFFNLENGGVHLDAKKKNGFEKTRAAYRRAAEISISPTSSASCEGSASLPREKRDAAAKSAASAGSQNLSPMRASAQARAAQNLSASIPPRASRSDIRENILMAPLAFCGKVSA